MFTTLISTNRYTVQNVEMNIDEIKEWSLNFFEI
jgi:hypothetical protein